MTMLQKSSNNPAISKPQGIYSDSTCFFNMRLINLCDFSYEGHLIYQYPMCGYHYHESYSGSLKSQQVKAN